MDSYNIAKFTAKDSVFRNLFKESKYLLKLYQALHPEDSEVSETDIVPVTLESVLMANLYNDVGFRVKNTILILVEAQSTWTMNVIIRMLMYLAETYNEYYKETEQSLYSTKKVDFPHPELYVIYTGEKGNKKNIISLSEEFLNGEKSSIDVTVKVLFDGNKGDIINQYVTFTKIYNKQVSIHGRTRKAVTETIKICEDSNVLREYLKDREKEVITIMMTLFDAEYTFDTYVKSEKRETAISIMVETCKEFGLSLDETIKRVAKKLSLPISIAENKVKEYWK